MKRALLRLLLVLTLVLPALSEAGHASLFGPWRRYRSQALGFQIPFVDDWQVTELKNVVVFAMQLNPDPYVRLAIGRIHGGPENFEQSVRAQITNSKETDVTLQPCHFDGYPAFRVERKAPTGRILDYYVDHGDYRYWISFTADRADLWNDYSKSFDIILRDFRFL